MQKLKEVYGISRGTLLLWERQGLIKPVRTPGGWRRYVKEDIERLLGLHSQEGESFQKEPDTILYARVSTHKQKEYLENQVKRLEDFAKEKGWHYEIISEIASGVNENRRGLRKLLNRVRSGKVKRVVIEYPDRLARFGFEYLAYFLETFGVEIIILNGEENQEDLNKELAEDLIAIVTSFAARIYGKRGGREHANSSG